MPAFIHTADIHLGSAVTSRFEEGVSAKIRRYTAEVFSRIIDEAEKVGVLLIAGDLFDSPDPPADIVSFVKRRFADIPDTKIFISAGNHDPYNADSVYAKVDFGSNVHVFSTEGEFFELENEGLCIYGSSFGSAHCKVPKGLPKASRHNGFVNIAVVHGELVNEGAASDYNGINKKIIADSGMDYVALGHIHRFDGINKSGETYYAYSGIPQGRGFDEMGDKGYLLCRGDKDGLDVRFIKTSICNLTEVSIDISDAEDGVHISEMIRARLQYFKNDFLKVRLVGKVHPALLNIDILKYECEGAFPYISLTDETRAPFDLEEVSQRDNLCGDFVRLMLNDAEVCDADEREIIFEAIDKGLSALLGGGGI